MPTTFESNSMRKLKFVPFLLVLGCIDPVDLDFNTDNSFVVIDGFITDQFGPHLIAITRTEPFINDDLNVPKPIRNAVVKVLDEFGNEELLTEGNDGFYRTSTAFRGAVGESYTLQVELGGNTYRSTPQTILEPSTLDSLYYETSTRTTFTDLGNEFIQDIVNLYVDLSFSSSDVFSALSWNGTFQWVAQLNAAQGVQCYVNEFDNGFSTIIDPADFGISQKEVLVDFLVNGDRFVERYSFNALIYTFGKDAYDYLNKVNDQSNSTGSVFDPLPFQINGNISNVSSDETVLGFFGAYSVDSRRVFFSNGDLQFPIISCTGGTGLGAPPPACLDCTAFPGAFTNRPTFWIN